MIERYETGVFWSDGISQNIGQYRSTKLDAFTLVMDLVREEAKTDPTILGGYVRDRCFRITRVFYLKPAPADKFQLELFPDGVGKLGLWR
jgi:hypothetical protein